MYVDVEYTAASLHGNTDLQRYSVSPPTSHPTQGHCYQELRVRNIVVFCSPLTCDCRCLFYSVVVLCTSGYM